MTVYKIPLSGLFSSKIRDIINAMLAGNKRRQVGRERYKVFPTSASEANNPQKVPKAK